MSSKNLSADRPNPTQKPAFFVLNPEARLSDLLNESGCLIERLGDLINATQNLEASVTEGAGQWLLSLLGAMQTATGQLRAINDRFIDVERKAKTAPWLDENAQAQFLERLQKRSNTKLNFPGSEYSASPENFQLYQRQANLDGMLELIELLAGIGLQVPAIIASAVESETGRVG